MRLLRRWWKQQICRHGSNATLALRTPSVPFPCQLWHLWFQKQQKKKKKKRKGIWHLCLLGFVVCREPRGGAEDSFGLSPKTNKLEIYSDGMDDPCEPKCLWIQAFRLPPAAICEWLCNLHHCFLTRVWHFKTLESTSGTVDLNASMATDETEFYSHVSHEKCIAVWNAFSSTEELMSSCRSWEAPHSLSVQDE